jgi:hypothetical protein
MSALIEKVARKMVDAYEAQFGSPDHGTDSMKHRWKAFEPEARAAIAAVAEWLDDYGDYYDEGTAEKLAKQLEQPK